MFETVLSLLGAMPAERRMSHAFPKIPALANEISDFLSPSVVLHQRLYKYEVFPFARFHKSPNSLSDQRLYKALMQVGLRFLPLRFDDGSTDFGNTKTEQINGWPSHGRNQTHCGTSSQTASKHGRLWEGLW